MSESRRPPYRDRIVEEASEWLVRLQDDQVSREDREAFAEWLVASPEHVREYLALAAIATDIGEAAPARAVDELVDLARRAVPQNVVPLPMVRTARDQPASESESQPPAIASAAVTDNKRRWWLRNPARYAAASSVGVLAVVFWMIAANAQPATYTTGVGEQKSFVLPDGSVVTLNAVSRLQVAYTARYRDVALVSGEALFTVAKSTVHPFRVFTGKDLIQAVGTRFDVYHRHADIAVTVVEGTVEIQQTGNVRPPASTPSVNLHEIGEAETSSASEHALPVLVARGQQARIADQGGSVKISSVDPAADIAWQDRRLIFDSRPLREVVAEFNLYNSTALEIDDPSVAEVQVSGNFYANDPGSFALFLDKAGIARPEDLASHRILLRGLRSR